MALKKQSFTEGEIAIFDEACIYKRGEYWQFHIWLPKENKYARKSLRTRSEATAIKNSKAAYLEIYANLQQGKSYFSITTKEGVEKYLSFRQRDVELGHTVKGRHQKTQNEQILRLFVHNHRYQINKTTETNVRKPVKSVWLVSV